MKPSDAKQLIDELETAAIMQWTTRGGYIEKDKNYNCLQEARKALMNALTKDF